MSIMPVTTAIYNAHTDKISSLLADIEEQFTLDEDVLISITLHFHKLFNLGLSEYGHPMAMMYAYTLYILVLFIHKGSQSFIRHWRSRWYGDRVMLDHASLVMCMCNIGYGSTFLALDLGGTNL
jgi:hexokinase